MLVELFRLEQSDKGVFGALLIEYEVFCVTLEPIDKDNIKSESCIPDGWYTCKRVNSPKYKKTFEIKGVSNRNHILFHPGNIIGHTKGCILLGQYWGKLKGERAILNSGNTFKAFMKKLEGFDSFRLHIIEI